MLYIVRDGKIAEATRAEVDAWIKADDRPKWVKVNGPRGALCVTIGKVYEVKRWDGEQPVVIDNDGDLWWLRGNGCSGVAFPSWVPAAAPKAKRAKKARKW